MRHRSPFRERAIIVTLHDAAAVNMIDVRSACQPDYSHPVIMGNFIDYRERRRFDAEKAAKATLFESARLLLGLNCLEPGQSQRVHTHADQDKFYFVLEGSGEFNVGGEISMGGPGCAIWAPAGVEHGMVARGDQRLVVLVGIAPAPHS